MQEHFKRALQEVLASEGGYVNDPDDAGGETYLGIARKSNPGWAGWVIVDRVKQSVDSRNYAAMNHALQVQEQLLELTAAFYKKSYWNAVRADEIVDGHVATVLFDFGVNAGPGTSIKVAKAVLGLPVNGTADDVFIQALNVVDPEKFVALFSLGKISRYLEICKNKPTNKKFFYGWVSRVMKGM
jgi:lysozyme family protein